MIIMKITLKDGSFKEYEGSMSVLDITKDISEGLARVATSARVNGEVVDLRHVVSEDCELEILTFDNEKGCILAYNISHHGTGDQTSVSRYKACNRTINREWILL